MSNLILYFSRKGQNYKNGKIVSLEKGNTERAAELIWDAVGGDLFEIRPAESYPIDYYDCTARAKKEAKDQARPLAQGVPDLTGVDTIFLGYPNWWGSCPMIIFSVLEQLDLADRRIIPFCTNEGSGMGSSEKDLRRTFPQAKVEAGLAIRGAEVEELADRIGSWAARYSPRLDGKEDTLDPEEENAGRTEEKEKAAAAAQMPHLPDHD